MTLCMVLSLFGCDNKNEVLGSFEEITYVECQQMFENEETFILVISQTTCSMCKEYKETINAYIQEYNVDIVYVEADRDQATFNDLWDTCFPDVTDTPTTLIVVNGEIKASVIGSLDADQISLLLKRNSMGAGSVSEVSNEKLQKWFENGKSFVMVVSQTTCPVCQAYKETLKEYVKENALDVVVVEADRDFETFQTVLWDVYFPDVEDTPSTCVVKDGVVQECIVGDLDSEQMQKFLSRNDVVLE